MLRVVLVKGLILYVVLGQNSGFEQECNILQTLEVLQTRLDSAETRLLEQEAELTDAVARLNEESIELDETKRSLADAVTHLQEQHTELTEPRSSLADAMTRLQEQGTEITNLKDSLTVLSHPPLNKTAFTARRSLLITNLGYRQTIIFDYAITNVNNCYSPTTGIFTTKTNGIFFFFVSIMTPTGGHMETEIVKNGINVAYTYTYLPEAFDQGANGAVLSLSEGDTVWVRKNNDYGNKAFGSGWCSFSGFQIQ